MLRVLLPTLFLSVSLIGNSQNQFAFDLYKTMGQDKNLLFSPTSIKSAFAMAFEGANGNTQKEFESVLGFREDNSAFYEEMKQLKNSAEICNSVWILDDFKVKPSYISTMKSSFDAVPQFTDFENDPTGSADKINKWIEESTEGMIQKMLTAEAVQKFKMALVNAIYFKQDWANPFNKERTKDDKFTNANGDKVDIRMMCSLEYFRALETGDEKLVELKYADEKTSMVIILPNKMKGYQLDHARYKDLTAKMYSQQVNLELPKFTFETPTFELKEFLQQMGLKSAFEDYADFSGMRDEKDLKIGTALHKAKIIVNEEGTEAAAATVIGMVATCSSVSQEPRILDIRVDKPFFYFIKDNATGSILFMGKMNEL